MNEWVRIRQEINLIVMLTWDRKIWCYKFRYDSWGNVNVNKCGEILLRWAISDPFLRIKLWIMRSKKLAMYEW